MSAGTRLGVGAGETFSCLSHGPARNREQASEEAARYDDGCAFFQHRLPHSDRGRTGKSLHAMSDVLDL